ncbi:HD domain-containing phosphohydrolase [Rhodoferax sp.]|uniref:HD-GYP domain-containing protein n=1 Tax=Rhodoferax sp. TaxID=50421 RepID=UPI00262F302B|nr:HD domain-containing phosphohydrolase [Rhodoferax sp.]MDD2917698.1 phosphodiesterase [Rhodoferax sp.]
MSFILKSEDEYEDLLGLWSDLEAGLAMILSHPNKVQEFEARIRQYDRWMQNLIQYDTDVALYLLFQLAAHSPVGYSASHALVCAVLSHLVAEEFHLPQAERDSLVHAALTMNIAMTELQDQLANQREQPTPDQKAAVRDHETRSADLLRHLGIKDEVWLQTVRQHHHQQAPDMPQYSLTVAQRLAQMLGVVDRYAAMISPRQSRAGRSATESAQDILNNDNMRSRLVGQTLLHVVGLFPPGTFVQLDDGSQGVVLRRSRQDNRPDVAILLNDNGQLLRPPSLNVCANGSPAISAALPAARVQEHLNHHLILQLGTQQQAIVR